VAQIELVDQTFRDGQQSLRGMRIRTGMLERAASLLDHLMRLQRPRQVMLSGRAGSLVLKRGETGAITHTSTPLGAS